MCLEKRELIIRSWVVRKLPLVEYCVLDQIMTTQQTCSPSIISCIIGSVKKSHDVCNVYAKCLILDASLVMTCGMIWKYTATSEGGDKMTSCISLA